MIRVLAFLSILMAALILYKGAVLLLQPNVKQGVRRLAYAVSGLWVGIPFLVLMSQEGWDIASVAHNEWMAWAMLAVVPNVLFWTLIWVLKGFRKDNESGI